ncbi:MAG: AAA family ATPase [bacterium]|nr:AAA family ATPase [bacterium]
MPHPAFSSIIGHDLVLRVLSHAIDHPGHAYLLTGPSSIGKTLVAEAFARALLSCENGSLLEAHPDFVRMKREEGAKEIVVKQARALLARMQLTGARGGKKVALIQQADDLNEESCNMLLKAVEEPSAQTVYIFVAEHADRLPATLRSRLTIITFHPIARPTIEHALIERGADASYAKKISDVASGKIGIAFHLLEDAGAWQEQTTAAQTLIRAFSSPTGFLCQTLEQTAQTLDAQEDTPEAWRAFLQTSMRTFAASATDQPEHFLRFGHGLIHAWHLTRTTLTPRLALEWAAVSPYHKEESTPAFLQIPYLSLKKSI